jgi:hypothetical protein
MVEATSNGDSLDALEPFIGEWRLVAAFEDMPPADGHSTTWEHDFDLTYTRA